MELQALACPSCGILFAVPREYFGARAADGRRFVCPNACAVQLGTAPPVHEQNRRLTETVEAQTAQLARAREDFEAILDANLRLAEQVSGLSRQLVDTIVGPATAEEGT